MRKKRTSQPILRGIRLGAAVFVAALAGWLMWLVGDPAAALNHLAELAGDAQTATALLGAELGIEPEGNGLSAWDRMVLAQSSLLGAPLPSETPEPDSTPTLDEPTASPELDLSNEGEDGEQLPTTTAPENIIPKTMVAGSNAKYITSGDVTIYNHTDYTLDIDALLAAAPQLSAAGDGPKILIYHSHATEAYTMDGTDLYEESDSYRTLNTQQNMVRIGEEMKAVFEAAGIEVIHDTTLYDYPSYNDAYSRSVQGVASALEQYPSLVLLLDVHRDALVASDGTIYKTVAGTVDNCAQVMMVMGSDATGQAHPNWKVNLALSVGIQSAAVKQWGTLVRPIVLRTSRFNQHLSTGAILVEVGTHGNTLQEAITAARLYAQVIAGLMPE